MFSLIQVDTQSMLSELSDGLGMAKPHWLSLVGGKESQCENDLVPILVGQDGFEPSIPVL